MTRTAAENADSERFGAQYDLMRSPVLQEVTQDVCGCGHIGTSWTTRAEADEILRTLKLGPADRLLDIGAGAGWPGLYFGRISGCQVTLLDLPEPGLRLALERAETDGMADRVKAVVGDAADPPFADGSFTAITHSDVLCCLVRKRDVLTACRRLIDDAGRMAFSVLRLAEGLTPETRRIGMDAGPDFVAAEAGYPEMLADTGWRIERKDDISLDYEASCARMFDAILKREIELEKLLGADEMEARKKRALVRLVGARRGLIKRELFFVRPA